MYIVIVLVLSLFMGLETSSTAMELDNRSKLASLRISSMDFREADIRDVIRYIGQESGLNIIIGDDVVRTVTLSFRDVSLLSAFNSILKINNLSYVEEGNIIRIIKGEDLQKEFSLDTEIIKLNYSDIKEASTIAASLISKDGSVAVDSRNSSLIVKDNPAALSKIRKIILQLDTKTPLILIETRIVEVNTNFSRELGVQWGGTASRTSGSGTFGATGGITQSSSGGSVLPLTGGIGLSGSNLLVNMPANVSSGLGGAIGFQFGNIRDTLRLDVQLSAMEEMGNGRVLSHPKILTLDNKEAVISSGTEILIPTSTIAISGTTSGGSLAGTQASTGITIIDAKLELRVRPHVTDDNKIMLYVKIDKKEPDFNRMVNNIPPLTSRTAETNLIVDDGDTVVIGGILTKNESHSNSGVPFLSQIPFLGRLFKKELKRSGQSELLIFLTPRILKDKSVVVDSVSLPYEGSVVFGETEND